MFIETYYDEKVPLPASTSEPVVPYPELLGETLTIWQKYLPVRRPIEHPNSWFNTEVIPGPVITEIERAKKETHLFERVEIWSRTDDPMAVGVIGGEKPRYFSIARWGDAQLTLEQVKRILRVEKWLCWLVSTGGIWILLIVLLAALAQR